MTNTTNPDLTDELVSAVRAALKESVTDVLLSEAETFLRPRLDDLVRHLIATDADIASQLPTRGTAAAVEAAIEPTVSGLVSGLPGRSFLADGASEFVSVVHPAVLDAVSTAVLAAPRKRARKDG